MNPSLLLVALVLLIANGLFVAMEFSLIASRRTKLETLAADGDARARFALDASQDLSLQLAGSQLGITMASLGLGAVAEPTLAHGLEAVFDGFLPDAIASATALVIGLGIVVFAHMVIGEMVPKNAAIADPEKMLLRLAIFNRVYVTLFRPVIRVLNSLANAGTRLFGVEPRDELESIHTAQEIATILAQSREGGLIEQTAHDLLSGALDFGERPLAEVMVPLDRVSSIPQRASVAEAEAVIVQTGHSRMVVIGSTPSNIIGFVHAKDLLTVPAENRDQALPLSRIRRVLVLGHDRPLDEVLVVMRRSRTHVAVVVDEHRSPVGLATLEDVLEDLVGSIVDESDRGVRARTAPTRHSGR